MFAAIRSIAYYLPSQNFGNEELVRDFPGWTAEKVEAKTGIANRHIAAPDEYASDMAVAAARELFAQGSYQPADIDFVLFCTQSPDYALPTSACLIQDRLGLPSHIGALDFNLGCSGFIYGLSLAKGLIESGEATHVLLLTAETYSKHIDPGDFGVRSIFGDAAAATLVVAQPNAPDAGGSWIGPFAYGTDGSGKESLISRRGALRNDEPPATQDQPNATGTRLDPTALFMNGPEIFNFTLKIVPEVISRLLAKAQCGLEDIDLFVFHQANQFMLEHLRRKLKIPPEKFMYALRDCGNTVSSTIPIALKRAGEEGRLRPNSLLMLVGFGVGYSWGANLVRWQGEAD